ncbi:MAG: hypothetical protein JWP25_6075 [Bradyrhizobium sp.]|nr:hypothetical protein [Bradyrhizobium sp.]
MSATRNNHYVPRWYQAGFFEPGRTTLAYFDLTPPQKTLDDGRVITGNSLVHWPTARCFQQRDLYSTFFGTLVSDEIERRLFGDIDARGAKALRAFAQTDVGEWHRKFQALFLYVDAQKIRTPKGLDWLRAQYPTLTQNDLMFEMQGIRSMHCTIWAEGVREIVSAEDSDTKFIISDHPVTIYNHAVPPDASSCAYPLDPSIALKASQTIFPLSRDLCMIFTNLEYAQNPATNPLEKRTFARNYRNSMVQTHAFICDRRLAAPDVARVNRIIRERASRFIAAGRKEWLHPDQSEGWDKLRNVLQPPKKELYRYGGETFAKFQDGSVYYQDAFGRTEKKRDFLNKPAPAKPLRPKDLCGCGYGRSFGECCEGKPPALRPSWTERGIRERNMMFFNALENVLGLAEPMDWVTVRRELTDEKIRTIYLLYGDLWPEDTDLLSLLPKPDGSPRAVYSGAIHPDAITDYALGAPLYFGELIIQHPFINARILNPKYSPVKNPSSYRQEVLKAIIFFLTVIPLVERGLVHLIPDPCDFDMHLRDQMMAMARARSAGIDPRPYQDERTHALMKEDTKRSIMSMPSALLRSEVRKIYPSQSEKELDVSLRQMLEVQQYDRLAVLQHEPFESGENHGRLNTMKLKPNFEMAMYLAQATGASIITDSPARWREIRMAVRRPARVRETALAALARNIGGSEFAFPQNVADIFTFASDKAFARYQPLMRDTFKYLAKLEERGPKPNVEQNLSGRFVRTHVVAQAALERTRREVKKAQIVSAFPKGGIQDNTVNRLLLMSSSEHHLPNVPMAFFIKPATTAAPLARKMQLPPLRKRPADDAPPLD